MREFRRLDFYDQLVFADADFEERLVCDLLEQMCFEHEAPMLARAVCQQLSEELVTGNQCAVLQARLERLAEQLYLQLVGVRAYRKGYLFYQFSRWWGSDILLVDFTNNER